MDEVKTSGIKAVGRKGVPKVDAEAIDSMQRMVTELPPLCSKSSFSLQEFRVG
jgi:hypothetical protein